MPLVIAGEPRAFRRPILEGRDSGHQVLLHHCEWAGVSMHGDVPRATLQSRPRIAGPRHDRLRSEF
jgi:hypothetical protein